MGKDLLLRYLRAWVGGYDLSGDALNIGRFLDELDQVMMSGWNEDVRKYLAGHSSVAIEGFQTFLNDAAGGAFTELKESGPTQVSFAFGSGGEPALGDPVFILAAEQFGDPLSWDNGRAILSVNFMPDTTQAPLANPWGRVVQAKGAVTDTGNGASIDDDAQTAAGAHAILHVFATSSGDFEFKIQDSPDDSAWADLITFTLDGSAIGSEYLTVTGTVDQYLRLVRTRTAGSATISATIARD
jgi:hypothetical protein